MAGVSGLAWATFTAEAVGAVGSAGAAIVAVVLANRERASRKAAEAESHSLRAAAERAHVLNVTATAGTGISLTAEGPPSIVVNVINGSDGPIFDIEGSLRFEWGLIWQLPPTQIIAARQSQGLYFEGSVGNREVDFTKTAVGFQFTDSNGTRWERHGTGLPSRVGG
jgi:hypothetical protein